jgi:hypothetical protein
MKPLFSFLLGLLAATASYAQVYEPQLLVEDTSSVLVSGLLTSEGDHFSMFSIGGGIRHTHIDTNLQIIGTYTLPVSYAQGLSDLERGADKKYYISGTRQVESLVVSTSLLAIDSASTPHWQSLSPLRGSFASTTGRLAIAPTGEIVVTGRNVPTNSSSYSLIRTTLTAFSTSGQLLWERTYKHGGSSFGLDVANAPGGGFWLLARRDRLPNDSILARGWLIRTNAQGDSLSSLHLGASHHEFIQIERRPDNTYLLMARSGAYVPRIKGSPVLYCISAEGNLLWQRQYHYLDDSTSHSRMTPIRLALTPDGGCVVLSGFAHPPYDTLVGYAEVDIHLMKLDAAGNKQWEKVFGTPDGDEAGDVVVMPGQGYAVCATSWGTIGSQPAPYLYLARFGPDGSTSAQPGLADASRLEVSPNPFSGSLSGSLRLAQPAAARLQLLDLQGRLILEQILPAGSSDFRLSTAALPAGIYLLRADAEGFSQAMKVLKE